GMFLRCWFHSLTTNELLSAGTGRPDVESFDILYRTVPLMGELPAADVIGQKIRLVGGRRAHDGAISGINASAHATPMGAEEFFAALDPGVPASSTQSLAAQWGS